MLGVTQETLHTMCSPVVLPHPRPLLLFSQAFAEWCLLVGGAWSLRGVGGELSSETQFPGIGEEDEVGIQVVSGTLGISEESSSTEIPV